MESRRVCELHSDFCCTNPNLQGRELRYGFSMKTSGSEDAGQGIPLFDGVIKHDLSLGKVAGFLQLKEGRVAGDMAFVPDEGRGEGKQSDGGWLIYFTHSLLDDKTWLEIVDAENIEGGSVAEIELPFIPIGFHALFLPSP